MSIMPAAADTLDLTQATASLPAGSGAGLTQLKPSPLPERMRGLPL
jgi:hypothetical protein